LKQDRNLAELALGKAFKNKKGDTLEEVKHQKLNKTSAPQANNEDCDKEYQLTEGFVPLTYAELIPEYNAANKNRKKKLRTKHQKELDEINQKRFEEWKASKHNQIPDFHKVEEDKNGQIDVDEPTTEIIDQNKGKEKQKLEEEGISLLKDDSEKAEQDGKNKAKVDEDVRIKICDLGNGCWRHHHFSSAIQTRQYRSPETIIGLTYGTSADIWSFACMIFEMITGDFLFEPRKGHNFDKDDDHLAQMMEILGRMPKNLAFSGRLSKRFFDKSGHLLKIRGLQHWPLKKVLMEKYRFVENEAKALADFLLPMLEWYPERRATAQEMLKHPWLNMESNYDYLLSERDYQVMMLKSKLSQGPTEEDVFENETFKLSLISETSKKNAGNKEMSELGESDIDMFNAD
jgi:serine/threonine-protein kinase SRPK3